MVSSVRSLLMLFLVCCSSGCGWMVVVGVMGVLLFIWCLLGSGIGFLLVFVICIMLSDDLKK